MFLTIICKCSLSLSVFIVRLSVRVFLVCLVVVFMGRAAWNKTDLLKYLINDYQYFDHSLLPRDTTQSAVCHGKLSVRPSVCLCVCVTVCDVVYRLSTATNMYDLEWRLGEIQGHWFHKCHKNSEIELGMTAIPCRVAGCISIRPAYSLVHLLTRTVGSGHIKLAISPKRLKMKQTLLLTAYIQSYTAGLSIAAKMYVLESVA